MSLERPKSRPCTSRTSSPKPVCSLVVRSVFVILAWFLKRKQSYAWYWTEQPFGVKTFPSDNSKLAEMEFYLVADLECDLTVFHPYRTLMALCKKESTNESTTEAGEVGAEVDDGPRYWGMGEGQLELSNDALQLAWYGFHTLFSFPLVDVFTECSARPPGPSSTIPTGPICVFYTRHTSSPSQRFISPSFYTDPRGTSSYKSHPRTFTTTLTTRCGDHPAKRPTHLSNPKNRKTSLASLPA